MNEMSKVKGQRSKVDLSIIIVNWKVADLVGGLLRSVAAETSGLTYEIFVVDNASGDKIAEVVAGFRAAHPEVRLELITNQINLGFAGANNLGISRAAGRYFVLLNPDTLVQGGALQKMVAWLDRHPEAGIAGPTLLNADGSVQPSVRQLPGLADQALILMKVHRLCRSLGPLRRYFAAGFDYSREADVEQVMGAAFFIRRELLEEIGPLDERFFIWFEEVDYCQRALAAGWRVVYTPAARIVHLGGESFAREMTWRKQRVFTSSLLKYFWKHYGAGAVLALIVPAKVGLLEAAIISLWKNYRRARRCR